MLTAAQLTTLNTDIKANANTIPAGQPWSQQFVGTAVSQVPNTGDGNAAIAGWYNLLTLAFQVYRNNIPVSEIYNQITWANMTPADAVPTDTALNNAIWQSRSLACQGKQFNLQLMIGGANATLDATRTATVTGLQDALQHYPAGANGINKDAGWAAVQAVLFTLASNIEKLFATGTGSSGSPATRNYYGTITGDDVQQARNLG